VFKMNNIEKIIKEINEMFNINSASYRYYSEEDSYFILLNDKELFESDNFQEYIFTKKTELWKEGIFNIHFDYEGQTVVTEIYDYVASNYISQAIEVPVSLLMPQVGSLVETCSVKVPGFGELSAIAAENYYYVASNWISHTIEVPACLSLYQEKCTVGVPVLGHLSDSYNLFEGYSKTVIEGSEEEDWALAA